MLRILIILCSFSFTVVAQNRIVVDSLLHQLTVAKKDTLRVNLYNQLAWENRNSNFSVTDSFATLAIQLGKEIKFCKGIGNGYINKALVHRNEGENELAIQACRWALIQFISCGYVPGYASAFNTIASIHYMMSNHSIAQYYYFKSLKISEDINDEKGMARTLNNIGVILMEQKQYDKALVYYQKCYSILERQKDENGMADCLNNIGNIYQIHNNTPLAVASFQKCAAINERVGDKKDVSSALHNIGLSYYENGDYKKALTYYHQSLLIDETLGDIPAIVLTFGNIADCYIKLNMYHAALKYAKESLQMAQGFNMKTDIMNAYELLFKIEEKNHNYKGALAFHQLYKQYSDSIYNIETTQRVSDLEAQYLKEKYDKQQLLLNKDEEISLIRTQEKEHAVTQYIFIIGLVLIVFVSIVYIVFFLIRKTKYS